MRVLGTAGHVDHGKSTLVEALTGTHPDRLKEEREREMTIDLGFAWFDLPGGEPVGVIDVPGHRDFIENMLAGVGGIDAALFVVAADEGVMPQTREHLAILDLLQIPAGVIALTKIDLAESDEWIALVAAEVAEAMRGTVLEGAPLIPVSARRGLGLDELRQALKRQLDRVAARPDLGLPRLPIDRVFTISGFGTVVTGTLAEGALSVGDEVEILPRGLRARVRGLQTHKKKLQQAEPGSRAAVNLTGVETSEVKRGDVLAVPGRLRPTTLVDVRYRHLLDAEAALRHNAQVKLFVGAAEVVGKVRVLGVDELPPGATGWLQLALAEPVAVAKGDRFILRRPSPGATIGGGQIVDPHPARKHRRKDAAVLARLETLLQGTPAEMLLQAVEALGPGSLREAVRKSSLDAEAVAEALAELAIASDQPHSPSPAASESIAPVDLESRLQPVNSIDHRVTLVTLEPHAALTPDSDTLVTTSARWARLTREIHSALEAYHLANPLRAGMPREELKSRLRLTPRVFNAVMALGAAQGALLEAGPSLRLPSHEVGFTLAQQAQVDALLAACRQNPYGTPSVKDTQAAVGEAVYAALVEQGALVQLNEDVFFLAETYREMVARVRAALIERGKLTVAEVRDMFSASRKYALALMEHLDSQGITVRKGDERVLKTRS